MSERRPPSWLVGCLLGSLLATGCVGPEKKLAYVGKTDLTYYRDKALRIDQPCEEQPVPESVQVTAEPRTVRDRKNDAVWDLTLVEAVHTALSNSRIIRATGQFRTGANSLLANGDSAASVYDPAIQESGVLFGRRGVEAALSDFDAALTTSMIWGRDERVANSSFFNGIPGGVLTNETAAFDVGLRKQFATGGTINVFHEWDYLGTNAETVLFPSSYAGGVGLSYRQPLLAGAGAEYTRIAGPINPNFGAITGVSQGVVIARINQDITLADFELSVRNLLRDVENQYWELYLRYRLYDTTIKSRNSALRSWRDAELKRKVGGIEGFKLADEAQARDRYFETRAQVETVLSDLYTSEVALRRLVGLPVNDGRVIRPADEPATSEFVPEWYMSLTEALTRRTELRRQKFGIKSLELQLQAARSLTKPRFDLVSGYRVNGFGNRLIGDSDNDGVTGQGFQNAYESLTAGNQTGWNLGFEFSMPVGFRSAQAQVRNIELRLAKSRDVLGVQEQDIAHELAAAVQDLTVHYQTAQTNYNRTEAALARLDILQKEYEAGTRDATLDAVLRAQASVAQAEVAYYTSLVRYSQAVVDLHTAKGSLLDHNGVQLAEADWTPEAYKDVLRRAWARSHAIPARGLHTEPGEFAAPQVDVPIPFLKNQPAPGPDGAPIPVPEPAPFPGAAPGPVPAPPADPAPAANPANPAPARPAPRIEPDPFGFPPPRTPAVPTNPAPAVPAAPAPAATGVPATPTAPPNAVGPAVEAPVSPAPQSPAARPVAPDPFALPPSGPQSSTGTPSGAASYEEGFAPTSSTRTEVRRTTPAGGALQIVPRFVSAPPVPIAAPAVRESAGVPQAPAVLDPPERSEPAAAWTKTPAGAGGTWKSRTALVPPPGSFALPTDPAAVP